MTNHLDLDTSPCVVAEGRRDENGYVRVGKRSRAHRIAWEEANGRPVPSGLVVMHLCDNPPCVNPEHLMVGTVADNNRDRQAKGRSRGLFKSGPDHPATKRSGERHWLARLSGRDVAAIRQRRAAGESTVALAAAFGVHTATISRIARGIWRTEVSA